MAKNRYGHPVTMYSDYFADVTDKTSGVRLHRMARVQDHDHFVAVWSSPRTAPTVYSLDDVTVVTVRNTQGCRHPVCRGKASRGRLSRIWRESGLAPFAEPEPDPDPEPEPEPAPAGEAALTINLDGDA